MSYPKNPGESTGGGPAGGPSHIPPTPRWPLAVFVIVALAVVALAFLAHAR